MIESGDYIRELFLKPVGTSVVAQGWVKTARSGKGVHFIQLSDGSCFQDLQVVADPDKVPDTVSTGACLRIEGTLVASLGAGLYTGGHTSRNGLPNSDLRSDFAFEAVTLDIGRRRE